MKINLAAAALLLAVAASAQVVKWDLLAAGGAAQLAGWRARPAESRGGRRE